MTEFLETKVDKFTFKVATDRYYNAQGVWVLKEGSVARIGLSDFVQQRSGDVAFVDVKPLGTALTVEDEAVAIETIKVTITFNSPVTGNLVRINPAMESAPEVINQDPYGDGWMAEIETSDWEMDRAKLMDAPTYFVQMKQEAEEEAKKL
ncbi:MAG: glycine cleavage system protein H [Chloroflexota bacterium]